MYNRLMQHDSRNIENLVAYKTQLELTTSTSTGHNSNVKYNHQSVPSQEIDNNNNNNYNNDSNYNISNEEVTLPKQKSVHVEFQRQQVQLLETITKNSLLTFIIIIGDTPYKILFVVLHYQATFNQHLWFATSFMLYVTAFCDLISVVFSYAYSKKYYTMYCKKCHTMCGLMCHSLAEKRVHNKVVELQTVQSNQSNQ